jgi:hypothetical protein
MEKKQPDYHDAELVLRAYELRRETVMRESRTKINRDFLPKTLAEAEAVMQPTHPLNAAFRQTSSYWEMVYGFARHGVVDPDFFVESNGEGLFLYAKFQPFLKTLREKGSATMFRNSEWIATECEEGRKRFALIQKRVQAMIAAAQGGNA